MTIYIRLPGLLNKIQISAKEEKSRTFYNTDGLINCLPQPGQFHNQLPKSMRVKLLQLIKFCGTLTVPAAETKSIGLPADARVVMVFAAPLRQFHRDPKPHIHLPGLAKTTPPRRRRQLN